MTKHRGNGFKRIAFAALAALTLLGGCSAGSQAATEEAAEDSASGTASTFSLEPTALMAANADFTTVDPDDWQAEDAVSIDLKTDTASSSGPGVVISKSSFTITAAGVYHLSGTWHGGITIAAPDSAQVVVILDGVTIANTSGPAINIKSADDAAIHLASGSTNTVSDAGSYDDSADANAAIYASVDLTISGEGTLNVTGKGGHGIKSTDDLVVLSGEITVDAAEDALRGKDALVILGGSLDLQAKAGDGLKAKGDSDEASADIDWSRGYIYVAGGTLDVTAGDDGLQAFTDTVIAGGTVDVAVEDDGVKGEVAVAIGNLDGDESGDNRTPVVTVTSSTESIEAANIGISAGTVEVTATDDGINASGKTDLQALKNGTTSSDAASSSTDSKFSEPRDEFATTSADPSSTSSGPSGDQEAFADSDTRGPGHAPGDMPPSNEDGPRGPMGGGEFSDSGERLEISGGIVTVDAEGDGIDSNGSLTISSGDIVIYGPTQGGNGSLDANGTFTLSGGTLAAFGSNSMEITPTAGDQNWVYFTADISESQMLELTDRDDAKIASLTARKRAASLIYSDSSIDDGATYVIASDGATVADAVAGEASEQQQMGPSSGGPGMNGWGGKEPDDSMADGTSGQSSNSGDSKASSGANSSSAEDATA